MLSITVTAGTTEEWQYSHVSVDIFVHSRLALLQHISHGLCFVAFRPESIYLGQHVANVTVCF
jgi:hypothetical protein